MQCKKTSTFVVNFKQCKQKKMRGWGRCRTSCRGFGENEKKKGAKHLYSRDFKVNSSRNGQWFPEILMEQEKKKKKKKERKKRNIIYEKEVDIQGIFFGGCLVFLVNI